MLRSRNSEGVADSRISILYKCFGSAANERLSLDGLPGAEGSRWIKSFKGIVRPTRK